MLLAHYPPRARCAAAGRRKPHHVRSRCREQQALLTCLGDHDQGRPRLVDRVITLGTPFSGDPHANNAWRLYEFLNDHKVDHPPLQIAQTAKPPVPTIAVWSPNDGVVAPEAARGLPDESDRQVEVTARHLGLARDPAAIRTIGDLLAG